MIVSDVTTRPLGKYMHVRYLRSSPSLKTHVYAIEDRHGGTLGTVAWYPAWRQYCFSPESERCVFSPDCLQEIATLLKRQTEDCQRNRKTT